MELDRLETNKMPEQVENCLCYVHVFTLCYIVLISVDPMPLV